MATFRQIYRQAGRPAGRQKDRQTDIQTDKQTKRKTDFEIFISTVLYFFVVHLYSKHIYLVVNALLYYTGGGGGTLEAP